MSFTDFCEVVAVLSVLHEEVIRTEDNPIELDLSGTSYFINH